jgi:hypothetical protein
MRLIEITAIYASPPGGAAAAWPVLLAKDLAAAGLLNNPPAFWACHWGARAEHFLWKVARRN